MIEQYYEREKRYLHEVGREFAERYPDKARFLSLGDSQDADPFVERMLEGFSFLAARIHQTLDNEIPQHTEGLFNLLWPHFLRPIPSLAMLEFTPKDTLQESLTIHKGAEIWARGKRREEPSEYRFVTTRSVTVHPLTLTDAYLEWKADRVGKSRAIIKFELKRNGNFDKLRLNPLRLHFTADRSVSSTMLLFFIHHLVKANVMVSEKEEPSQTILTLRKKDIQPGGFGSDQDDPSQNEGLLPYSDHSFSGFRYLQEYFSFREKFWCIDIHGLDQLRPPKGCDQFQIVFFFDREYPNSQSFGRNDIRLHCTPIVNLFHSPTDPINLDHKLSQYRISPRSRSRDHIEIYRTEKVSGFDRTTGKRYEYLPFFSFETHHRLSQGNKKQRYFTTAIERSPSGRYDTFISLFGFDYTDVKSETISLDALCTNGSLPSEYLGPGRIQHPGPDFPNLVTFSNLTKPTRDYHPPLYKEKGGYQDTIKNYFWQLISHLSLNFMTLAHPDAMVSLLKLYDWVKSGDNQRCIESVTRVSWKPVDRIHRGTVIRGVEVTVNVKEDHFAEEGDLFLFGLVLSHFFSLYATVNSFVRLKIVSANHEYRYEEQPDERGKSWVI
ncbi:MAG: hypothetical protein B6244_03945 [Candidatus Cloacimonetes bacterium 4572_55]|nr:MAG: hypothetical protein B6244_03945 [Candidatus Cloacimonetes bacterium 4572_55]